MPVIPIRDPAHWHELRATRIGASETAILFGAGAGYHPSLFTLWNVKQGRIPDPFKETNRTEAGRRYERATAEWVAESEGWKIRPFPGYAAHDTIEGLGATPDFEIMEHPDGPGLLETKWVHWLQHKKVWGDEPPLAIQIQLQTQFACTGYEWGAVGIVLDGCQPTAYRFARRPKIVAEIERRIAAFWQSIRDGKEPPVDGSDSTAGTLRALFPEDDGIEVPADLTSDNSLPELCASMLTAGAARREAEKAEGLAKNGILAKLGEHRAAWCQGYLIKAASIADNPGTLITPEMIGTFTGARRGHRRITIKETAA